MQTTCSRRLEVQSSSVRKVRVRQVLVTSAISPQRYLSPLPACFRLRDLSDGAVLSQGYLTGAVRATLSGPALDNRVK
jgi:hypothetical protein